MNVNFKQKYPPITEETRLRNALTDKIVENEKLHKEIRDLEEILFEFKTIFRDRLVQVAPEPYSPLQAYEVSMD